MFVVLSAEEREKINYKKYQEYLSSMKKLSKNDGVAQAHIIADGLLCDFLCDLGYGKIVEVYNSLDKWYG